MKKEIFALVFGLFIFLSDGSAQMTFQKTFSRGVTNDGNSVVQTSDNGYAILTSVRNTLTSSRYLFLVKTNSMGDTLWTKAYIQTNIDDGSFGRYLQQTSDGGYIIIANHADNIGLIALMIKTDSIGNLVWTKSFLNCDNLNSREAGQQTNDGGYITVGNLVNPFIMYLIKTNSNGNILWTTLFNVGFFSFGSSVKQTSDGGYIVTGTSFVNGNYQISLFKMDGNGNLQWNKVFSGISDDSGLSAIESAVGGYIITGDTRSNGTGIKNAFLIKTNSIGDTLWTKTYGGLANDEVTGFSVIQANDGGFLICGTAIFAGNGDFGILIKTDGAGNQIWSRIYGSGNESLSQLRQTNDGGYILIGEGSFGSQQAYLVKTDGNGNSGCYDSAYYFNESAFPVQVSSPAATVGSNVSLHTLSTTTAIGGTATTLCLATGTNEITFDDVFEIFPNPTIESFSIYLNRSISNGNLVIYNMMGQIFYSEKIFIEASKTINIKNMPQGVYLVKFFDGDKDYYRKIIVGQN